MAPHSGGWSAFRSAIEGHRVAARIVFASEPAPGVTLSSALERAKDAAVVADVSAALFAMRRLLATADMLHDATGAPAFAIGHDRIFVTPRGALLVGEPDADTFELCAGPAGTPLDIAQIAIVGVSLMAGRAVDAIEASDPQSALLKEMRDATAIRADMTFAGALHEWLERALSGDPASGFRDFQSARTALAGLRAPRGCRPSRKTLRSFVGDLQPPEFASPKLAVAETEYVHDVHRRLKPHRPVVAAHSDEDDSWASLDFSDSSHHAAAEPPAAPPPTPASFESSDAFDGSVEFEPYTPAEIPGEFRVPEPEKEPEPEPAADESSIFVAPSRYQAPPEPRPEPEREAATEAASESVWGTQSYTSESAAKPSTKPEDPNSWIPTEARPTDERPADEPMTMSWLPGEARQALMPNDADAAGWLMDAKSSSVGAPTPIEEAAPPPPPPSPPVVDDDKDWFKPAPQEMAPPPAAEDKDWFKSPAQQAAGSAVEDKDWFNTAPPPAPEQTEEEEQSAAEDQEDWAPEPVQSLDVEPSAELPPTPVELPSESARWDKRSAPLRDESDLTEQRPDLDAPPATIVHGAGASIAAERPLVAPAEEEKKPKRERRPIHIETPSAGSAIRTIVVTAALAGAAVWGLFYYLHMSTPGTITFESTPKGLDLLQDGTVKGKTPVTLTLRPGQYDFELRRGKTTKPLHIEVKEASHVTQKVDFSSLKPVGTLAISSDPAGAKITIDGKSRGNTPQTFTDIPIGSHVVVLDGEQGTLRRQVNVSEGDTTTIKEAIFPGFLKVDASFDVKVLEGGRVIGTSDGQISMRAGSHKIELVNESQNYRETKTVDINPGEIKRILAK